MDYKANFRKKFEIDEQFTADLKRAWELVEPCLDDMLTKFYQKVRNDADMFSFFRDDAHIAHAKAKQAEHWRRLFTEGFTDEYFESSETVGRTHFRIGLPNIIFTSMYALAGDLLHEAIANRRGIGGTRRKLRLLGVAHRAIIMDIEAVVSTYFLSRSEEQAKALDRLSGAVGELGTGELAARIDPPFPQSFENSRVSFNLMADRFEQVFGGVRMNADKVQGMAHALSGLSEDLSQRAQSQAASLEQSTAAVTELASSVRQSNESFTSVIDRSRSNSDAAERGLGDADQANAAMEVIRSSFQDIARTTQDIEEISFQTNLLALNASVEASRAGEAGKGFAVVASEVRSLAKRAAELTDTIRTMIESSGKAVEDGSNLVGRTKESLERIKETATDVQGEISAVVQTASEQAITISEIEKALGSIDSVTQQNAAVANELSEGCDELLTHSDELARPFDIFNDAPAAIPLTDLGQNAA